MLFGLVFGVDAVLKWLPGYRKTYLSGLKSAAAGQPAWLHGWFHFWIQLQAKSPMLFATLTGLAETGLALVLILGVARRAGCALGVVYSLPVWSVAEGFGGPYASGATDIGTGIVYALLFVTLLTFAPPRDANDSASTESWSQDGRAGGHSPRRTRWTESPEPRSSNRSPSEPNSRSGRPSIRPCPTNQP